MICWASVHFALGIVSLVLYAFKVLAAQSCARPVVRLHVRLLRQSNKRRTYADDSGIQATTTTSIVCRLSGSYVDNKNKNSYQANLIFLSYAIIPLYDKLERSSWSKRSTRRRGCAGLICPTWEVEGGHRVLALTLIPPPRTLIPTLFRTIWLPHKSQSPKLADGSCGCFDYSNLLGTPQGK